MVRDGVERKERREREKRKGEERKREAPSDIDIISPLLRFDMINHQVL